MPGGKAPFEKKFCGVREPRHGPHTWTHRGVKYDCDGTKNMSR